MLLPNVKSMLSRAEKLGLWSLHRLRRVDDVEFLKFALLCRCCSRAEPADWVP
jgi:hypothetical protein